MGRHKKTLAVLPKNWKQIVIKLKSEGASDVEVRAMLGISDDLWERWIKEIKVFALTIKKGRDLCQAWWERKGRINLENKNFNAVLWYMNMKNRFGWADKQEITGAGGAPIQIFFGIPDADPPKLAKLDPDKEIKSD